MSSVQTQAFPFDSINGDRAYAAKVFREYFGAFLGNGVYLGKYKNYGDNSLKVYVLSGVVKITKGAGFIEGVKFEITEDSTVELPNITGIYKVIARLNNNLDARGITIEVINNSIALTRDSNIYEIQLASVEVNVQTSSILVTDTRLDINLCGMVTSLITVDAADILENIQNKLIELEQQSNVALKTGVLQVNLNAEKTGGMNIEQMKNLFSTIPYKRYKNLGFSPIYSDDTYLMAISTNVISRYNKNTYVTDTLTIALNSGESLMYVNINQNKFELFRVNTSTKQIISRITLNISTLTYTETSINYTITDTSTNFNRIIWDQYNNVYVIETYASTYQHNLYIFNSAAVFVKKYVGCAYTTSYSAAQMQLVDDQGSLIYTVAGGAIAGKIAGYYQLSSYNNANASGTVYEFNSTNFIAQKIGKCVKTTTNQYGWSTNQLKIIVNNSAITFDMPPFLSLGGQLITNNDEIINANLYLKINDSYIN